MRFASHTPSLYQTISYEYLTITIGEMVWMSWKKHSRALADIEKSNREFSKEVDTRFDEIISDIGGSDNAVGLEFLKSHLSLNSRDDDAVTELRYMVKMTEEYEVKLVSSRKEQLVYVQFPKITADDSKG